MNFSIAKDQLIHGLQSVQNVVSTRTTLPILSNVLLRAEEGRLELTAHIEKHHRRVQGIALALEGTATT